MSLMKRVGIAFAALAAAVMVGQLTVISRANASSREVSEFRERAAVFQRSVLGMKGDFYLYDDQNNMYVLVAATSPDNQRLVEDTYEQGLRGSERFAVDLRG
ncbi:MAG: hypothetical protein R2715_05260 [Ilumatobacteraceae bacterium]